MPKIKLNFKDLSIPEKVARARQIVTALTNNTDFPSPQPTLAQVSAAINDLDTAYTEAQAARQEAKARTSAQNQKEDAVDRAVSRLASYVESASDGDETKIKGAGLDTRTVGSSSSDEITAPAALAATAGNHEGEIDLHWDKVSKARSYVIEMSADPPTVTSWQHKAVSLKSQATVEGLTSGTKYWFRVAAVSTNGQSGWSDPATKIAP
ncbi:MAG TPA: fibronectin type III domain-containing protein [Pyrinomonadaceae bacterium]|nr:fibronectin type III domain-containing protein [Pyrinomonadaceae bacterium]